MAIAQLIFNSGESGGALRDTINLLAWINDFAYSMNTPPLEIDETVLQSVISGMINDFPHCDGLENASPFKKVANFVAYFIANQPIKTRFDGSDFPQDLVNIDNHQNAIIALEIAVEALHQATIYCKTGEELKLTERIRFSLHSYCDIVGAIANITPASHFELLSVFFEQCAYKANPQCQYPLI